MDSGFGYRLARKFLRCLAPSRASTTIFLNFAASVGKFFSPSLQKLIAQNQQAVGKEPSSQSIYNCYRHFLSFLYEFLARPEEDAKLWARPEQQKEVRELLGPPENHGSAIILIAHLGNWECALRMLLDMGYRCASVSLPHQGAGVEAFFRELREHPNHQQLFVGESVRSFLGALEDGRLLALPCERDYTGSGTEVQFFGQKVIFPAGPAFLHKRSKAPIVLGHCERISLNRFSLEGKKIDIPEDWLKTKEGLLLISQKIAHNLEPLIQKVPEQWLTFFDFFKKGAPQTQP